MFVVGMQEVNRLIYYRVLWSPNGHCVNMCSILPCVFKVQRDTLVIFVSNCSLCLGAKGILW